MADLSNNLFYYATKELSQDAFICWLCSYALEDSKSLDEELTTCAYDLISEFMKRGLNSDIIKDNLQLKTIDKQIGNIDVLLTVYYDNKTYKIIIEDKIHSCEHDDQLRRYREQIKNKDVTVIGIYYKTGFQSNVSEVEKAGYAIFNREDILTVLRKCNTKNSIFINYREYWEDFEDASKSYRTKEFKNWDWRQINGFYDEMQIILGENDYWAGYGYVANRSGGFWGLWYGSNEDLIEKDSFKAVVYLQVEISWNNDSERYDLKICVKLENQSTDDKENEIHNLKYKILDEQQKNGFIKPKRLGSGTHVTVGVFKDAEEVNTYEEIKNCILKSIDSYSNMLENLKKIYTK